ncbi:exodeoxyribonuclease V subunit gamma [Myxococcota bacterium]|nr:exodeoxyribonuclease V subunit gamma [Myxococcota bacterium]MBU1429237.1 exodeoxyribonuclease V subunit gamma [Myxococcota bacterium]MBU1896616.1 exodeoxyribonuclease V subunit gamma [Myxococcota bacterium]
MPQLTPQGALEALLEDLKDLPDPFSSEWVIVEGDGAARWLQFQIAQRFGICSGLEFLTPEALQAVGATPPVWATLAEGEGLISRDEMEEALYISRARRGWRAVEAGEAPVTLRPSPYPGDR